MTDPTTYDSNMREVIWQVPLSFELDTVSNILNAINNATNKLERVLYRCFVSFPDGLLFATWS
jgi:hypothetical protein